jgi:hypothetical protein
MKATSLVMVNLQKPMTVFGLPPKLMAIVVGCVAVIDALLIIVGLGSLSLVFSLAVGTVGTVIVYRIGKRDPHCETSLITPSRFWKGRKKRRELLTGKPFAGTEKKR